MSFKEDFSRLVEQVIQRREVCRNNEEATKQALIMPFLQILGYDIWNPLELVPEYKAGWAKAEKVDYALFINQKPSVFIEAKSYGEKLVNYDAQLAKYFNSTPEVKIAIITDGVTYKFFTDVQQLNIMDKEPLFEFQIDMLKPQDFEVLNKLRKESFDVDSVILEAENLIYLNGFMKKLRQFFNNPSDDFIKFLASDIYPGRLTSKALERMHPLVKQAVSTTLVSMVSKGLSPHFSQRCVHIRCRVYFGGFY
ncbi:MAG: type I restriction enzyme HsdR N-terminal domain-containing protein [Candidatus Sericytochromatia bacterium]|nr:type I restriction enzyme HsdR N-terminal domain-containing protein [Candidatus Sericytochromatia bacterium]